MRSLPSIRLDTYLNTKARRGQALEEKEKREGKWMARKRGQGKLFTALFLHLYAWAWALSKRMGEKGIRIKPAAYLHQCADQTKPMTYRHATTIDTCGYHRERVNVRELQSIRKNDNEHQNHNHDYEIKMAWYLYLFVHRICTSVDSFILLISNF